jgi:hypothetical protein
VEAKRGSRSEVRRLGPPQRRFAIRSCTRAIGIASGQTRLHASQPPHAPAFAPARAASSPTRPSRSRSVSSREAAITASRGSSGGAPPTRAHSRLHGRAHSVGAVVSEEARDRVARAPHEELTEDVRGTRAHLQRGGAPAAGAREFAQEAAIAAPHRAASLARAAAASAVSSATPRPLRSRAGSKPPISSPAQNTRSAAGSPPGPSGRSCASTRTPAV